MKRAVREHLGDFAAILALLAFGTVVTIFILSQQRASFPEWFPLLGEERFEIKAEMSSAQAVTPGQGQTVNISGIKAGDVTEVELIEGEAVVTMEVEEQYADLIHPDATILLRPRTGLQDMTLELDPGKEGDPVEEGFTVPIANTEPNVNFDQILASLDGDTRAYVQLLLQASAEGLEGKNPERLSQGLKRLAPLARDLGTVNKALAKRRANIARVMTNFRAISEELAANDQELASFVTDSNDAMSAFANQEANLRESLARFPSALRATRGALESADQLATTATPALRRLIPAARALGPGLRAARPFLRKTVGPIRDQIRPFTRDVRTPIRHLTQISEPLQKSTRGLSGGFSNLNELTNALAYNPPGREEGYGFWLAWFNHNTNAIFQLQDGMGPLRRGLVAVDCFTALQAELTTFSVPQLQTLNLVSNTTRSEAPYCEPFVGP
ncbi:MCE family protein [Thermoleophilia bacterium SCSIO 60948]|nr:MCE family protein [Thermoleophilia bacterium SCSIO 60948]